VAVSDEEPKVQCNSKPYPCDHWGPQGANQLGLRSVISIIIIEGCLIKTMSNYLTSDCERLDHVKDEKRAH
jgi:hypothetical protein